MFKRPSSSLSERLQKFIANGRLQAEAMDPGVRREAMMVKVREAETRFRLQGWLASSDLRSPN
jgi:hypothetical protein